MLEQAAGFWLDAGETALAGEALDRAVALAPEAPGPRALRAELALRAGRFAEAEADLGVALAAWPGDAALLTRRAAARRLGGDPGGALADAISAGDGPAALVERGLAQAALGRRDAAIESWFAAIAADAPDGPAALRARDALQGLALD
jgi:tetratricopeptide (TPR) repeat protein